MPDCGDCPKRWRQLPGRLRDANLRDVAPLMKLAAASSVAAGVVGSPVSVVGAQACDSPEASRGGLPIGVFIGRFIVVGKEEARRWHWGVRVSQDAGRRHEDHGVVLAVLGDEQFGVPVQFTA